MTTSRVLITGGATGIGAATAARMKAAGHEPVIIDLVGDGIRADLSDPDQTAGALKKALAGGPILRLVNNVGMVRQAAAEETTMEDLEKVWSLNVRCAVQCMQALVPGVKAAGFGRIVNISSRAALGKEHRTSYASTKGALISLARVWALEFGAFGITVNAIGPGPIRTELFDRANPSDEPKTQAIIDSIPVKRVGTPEDVAHAAAFLMDDMSGYITGQVLYVCGGMTIGVAGV